MYDFDTPPEEFFEVFRRTILIPLATQRASQRRGVRGGRRDVGVGAAE